MADKSFIQMKLDKDNALNELKQVVPGLRALQYYHDNPDSSFANTLDLLAEDVVPFYAAHKYGAEPEDYVKEAFLVGMTPTKASAAKKFVKKHPDYDYYNFGNDLYYTKGDNEYGYRYGQGRPVNDLEMDMHEYLDGYDYPNIKEVIRDIDESANTNIPPSPYDLDNPNVNKSIEFSNHLQDLRNDKRMIEMAKLSNNYNVTLSDGTKLNRNNINNLLNKIDVEIKQTISDINVHNANMDFLPEYSEFGAPSVDINNLEEIGNNIYPKQNEYYNKHNIKNYNLKYPYRE